MLELFFSEYRLLLQDVLAFVLCFAALLWGGSPERIVAATWILVFEVGGRLYSAATGMGPQLLGVDWFLACSDFMAGLIFVWVALYANRNYTLWIAGVQLIAMMAHLARALAEPISPVTYAAMFIAPGWFQLLFLGAGLTRHILRKRRYGAYRDWRLTGNPANFEAAGKTSEVFSAALRTSQPSWRDDVK